MNCDSLLKMRELELESEEDPKQEPVLDEHIYDESETIFTACPLTIEEHVSPKNYILNITATQDNNPTIAASLSDNTVELYILGDGHLAKTATITGHTDVITEVKFTWESNNLIYTGSHDGSVKLWDLRTPHTPSLQFKDTTLKQTQVKKINTFDISPNNLLLAAGTDLFYDDSFILFWDLRKTSLLGGYWDSHRDDVTQIRFHASDSNKMISGSVDGLINLFDLSQSEEDDALMDSLNTESSVEKLQWHLDKQGKDVISCITHTADVQFWKLEDAQPYCHLHRNDVAQAIHQQLKDTYVVDVHSDPNNMTVLAGSSYNGGECFRGFAMFGSTVIPTAGFPGNKQRVRASWYNPNFNLLLTGGEKGIISVWDAKQMSSVIIKKEGNRK